ncbi:PQQ-binding-like beta-propeller repeat protein [Planctomycetota bacterium]
MLKFQRFGFVLVGFLLFFVQGCAKEAQWLETDSVPLVSGSLLEAGNFEKVWGNKLPLKQFENLTELRVVGNRVYILSEQNYVFALSKATGTIVFSRPLSAAGMPMVGLELHDDKLFSLIGNRLIEIEPEFGKEISSRNLVFNITCPAVRNDNYFYIAGSDSRLHALRSKDKVQVFEASSGVGSLITSMVADDKFLVFATDAGDVKSIAPDDPRQLWSFKAGQAVVGPVVRQGKWLYVASADTNVYKINIFTGKLAWIYKSGAVLGRGPAVTKNIVYQYVHNRGLAAISNRSGKLLWQLDRGIDLLAESAGMAYVITGTGELVTMDNKTGKQLNSVVIDLVSKYVVNTEDENIYIADQSGRISCIKPVK